MEEDLEKIKILVASGQTENIDIAFELIKGLNLEVDEVLAGYRILLKLYKDESLTTSLLTEAKHWLMLDLSKLGLTELPEEIGYFEDLNSIDLSENKLCDLPESLKQLKNLQALKLNNNYIVQIPEVVYQLGNLHQLYLNYNPITHLSPKLVKLKHLSQIGLRGCKLTEFPKALCIEIVKYFQLDLGENKLEYLPDEFGNFNQLHYLHLDSNILKALPLSINKLRYLQELDLSYNPFLKEIPSNLQNLKSLANIYLAKTPIQNLSEAQKELPWTEFWV